MITLALPPFVVNGNAFAAIFVIAGIGVLYMLFDMFGVVDNERSFGWARRQSNHESEALEDIDELTQSAMDRILDDLREARR